MGDFAFRGDGAELEVVPFRREKRKDEERLIARCASRPGWSGFPDPSTPPRFVAFVTTDTSFTSPSAPTSTPSSTLMTSTTSSPTPVSAPLPKTTEKIRK